MRKGSPAVGPYTSGTKFTISAHSKAIDPAKPSANNRHFQGKSWFIKSSAPTDLTIRVHGVAFHVHKSALLSRSGYLTRFEHETPGSEGSELLIDDFPCQPDVFKMVVNFCYGAGVEITAGNVAALRCAAEFMEMTESVAEGNLVAKTESFLALVALPSWRHSFAVLRSCETLPSLAETHLIARRCCESIASKVRCQDGVGSDGWLEDLSSLRIEHFSRVITMVAAKGGNPEVVAVSIAKYAEKRLTDGRGTATGDSELRNSSRMGLPETENEETGTSPFHNHRFLEEMRHAQIGGRKEKEKESATLHHTGSMLGLGSFGTESVTEKRRMVESLVSLLPAGKDVIDVGLLLGMLKAAVRLGAAPALVGELEKRVGMNLEKTSAEDLLSLVSGGQDGSNGGGNGGCGGGDDGVEMVQRLVEYFLMQDDREGKLAVVAKILDGYLAEIAKRPDLKPARFQVIAEALPEFARTCDDGLYRAIDTYLKAHQTLTEHERRRVCRAMNCRKLTVDARLHAARNERLPLRTVITVLHEEQVKMRGNYLLEEHLRHDVGELRGNCRCEGEVSSLRAEVEKIKEMLTEQQSYWMELQEEMGKQTRQKNGPAGGWSSGWKKIKNYSLFQGKMINGGTNDLRQKHMLGVQLSPKNDRIRRMSLS